MQDEEYERSLQLDIEREQREEREAEMARQAEEQDEQPEAEEPTCLTLEELRARRLRFFQPPPARPTRCGAATRSGVPCRRYAAQGLHGRCPAHRTQT